MTSAPLSQNAALLTRLTGVLEALEQGRAVLPADEKLGDLVQQLHIHSQQIKTKTSAPIRTIHHFACTGGTLISRFLAATANARLLSEVDPLSPLSKGGFSPLDLALQYHNASATPDALGLQDIFLAGLDAIYQRTCARGERLILRDHAHSHFCTGPKVPERPSLKQIIAPHYRVLSVVTVRHPLDSYLSVLHNKFTHFTPGTLEDYAQRYSAFLDTYEGEQIIKYEDFITDHTATLKALCTCLDLPNSVDLKNIVPAMTLTGDSGRRGVTLELRARRAVPKDIQHMCDTSAQYQTLCKRLGYAPQEDSPKP